MNTLERNFIGLRGKLALNRPESTLYDVYLNNRGAKTTCSVPLKQPKSVTFLDTGRVIIGCNYSVAQRPAMDASALLLQSALLHHAKESQYYWSDMALKAMCVGLCLYVAVSLCIWGSV